jgi:hypothetical protein
MTIMKTLILCPKVYICKTFILRVILKNTSIKLVRLTIAKVAGITKLESKTIWKLTVSSKTLASR